MLVPTALRFCVRQSGRLGPEEREPHIWTPLPEVWSLSVQVSTRCQCLGHVDYAFRAARTENP